MHLQCHEHFIPWLCVPIHIHALVQPPPFLHLNKYIKNSLKFLKHSNFLYKHSSTYKHGNYTKNKRPKGPHIVHLSTMCHLLWWIGQDGHFYSLFGPKNTNLVEDVKILLPVKFRWILFSGFRGKVKICLSQSEAILFFWSARKTQTW